MNRRTLLQRTVPVALVALTGCSAVKCRIDGDYDRLTVEPTSRPDPERSIVVDVEELSPAVQNTVDEAIASGSVKQCHDFGTGTTDVEALWSHIETKWEETGETDFEKLERTYLRRKAEHFGLEIRLLDYGTVDSIPYRGDDT